MKSIVVALLIVCICHGLWAQNNSLVLDGAYINLSGGTGSNNVYMVIDQPAATGILRRASGGHIYTNGQYNFVKWNVGLGTGTYVIPFGVAGTAASYIPLTINKTSSGNSNIIASTWSTNQQNVPHPGASNVTACYVMKGTGDSITTAVDRFWDIRSTSSMSSNITFSYLGTENTITSPTSSLKVQRWTNTSSCGGWSALEGTGNTGVTTGVGTVGPVVNVSGYSPYSIVRSAAPFKQELAANAGADVFISFGSTVTIGGSPSASGGSTPFVYAWSPSSYLNATTAINPVSSAISNMTYTLTVTDQQNCIAKDMVDVLLATDFPCAVLKKNLDNSYFEVKNGYLYFKHEEEYVSSSLTYSVFDKSRNVVNAPLGNGSTKKIGDNRYILDCRNLVTGQYYILEVMNGKNEIAKLRFKVT
jgi:hypothetical protein